MENNKKLILAHPSMQSVASLSESVNVMLTPQFYTFKKEALPLKYAYQARKIAPSLFEGLLEEGRSYDYLVFKQEDKWAFIAYDAEKISQFLASKGIPTEYISKLFFAQQSLASFTHPLYLSEKEALVALDGTVVVVPRQLLEDDQRASLVFDDSFTPKKGVHLEGTYGSLLTLKQALSLATICILFAGMFFVEGLRYGGDSQTGEEEMQTLFEANPELQSSYAREEIATKYRAIDTAERAKRETIKTLSGMIFKGVTLTSLHLEEKKFTAQFACTDATVAKRLEELAKKEKFNASKTEGSSNLRIEGAL